MAGASSPRPRPLVGIALQNDAPFLAANAALIDRAELFELAPETAWRAGGEPGAGHAELLALVRAQRKPVIGHGVLFSLGAAEPPARRAAWLAALRRDTAAFGFAWLSDHLGFADAGGLHTALPLPLPPTEEAVAVAAAGLRALRTVHDVVAFENNADYFCLGDPLAQPPFFRAICERAGAFLLLDLHNAYVSCLAANADFEAWLDRVPWDRVLELHLAGGSDSDADWLPSRRVVRLDSHDGAVPDPVWRAFTASLPRATALRAVVLEWQPEGMTAADAARFAADFDRAKGLAC